MANHTHLGTAREESPGLTGEPVSIGRVSGGTTLWTAAYVLLTGLLLVVGTLGLVSAVTAVLSGLAAAAVILPVGIGVFAASPSLARGALIAVHRRLPEGRLSDADEFRFVPEGTTEELHR